MINLPPQAIDHFNSKSEELLKSVTRVVGNRETKVEVESSIKHKKPIILLDNVGDIKFYGKNGERGVINKKYTIGFLSNESAQKFNQFLALLYKRVELTTYCSDSIIEQASFNWFIQRSEDSLTVNFTQYLLRELNDNCKDYMFFFPVLYLDVEKPFNVGKVQIDFFTDERLEAFKNSNLIRGENLEDFKKEFSGQVNASIAVGKRDSSKAESVALQACGLALDVLKMFSPTVYDPLMSCDFGLESRVNFNPGSHPMSLELEDVDGKILGKNLNLLIRNHARPFMIDQKALEKMKKNGFGVLSNFIAAPNLNELGELTLQSIMFYAEAISNRNLHKRIVDLFTIIESFVVKNENEPILNSITKYFPKIVSKEPTDRNTVKEMLTELYAVRSAMIHHGKANNFEIRKLIMLQESIRVFIINMTEIGKKHENKNSFLSEIDDAINSAY